MSSEIIQNLKDLLVKDPPWGLKDRLMSYIKQLETEYQPKSRTVTQNNSLHLMFEQTAQKLNEAGYTVQLILKEKVDLDWDATKVKELLWRPAQQAILGKTSTRDLAKTEDIDKVFDHLNRHLSEKFGLSLEFPHKEIWDLVY